MATELWLVRHGQAAFATDDYDRLTELGFDQARWLGEHLAHLEIGFDRICSGTLRRQRETAETVREVIGGPEVEVIEGFEEYDAKGLMARAGHRDQDPNRTRREHFRTLRRLLGEWSRDEVEGSETWAQYNERARTALMRAREGDPKRVMVASSGGTIALMLMQATGMPVETMIEMNLQTRNSSVSRLVFAGERVYLNMFNAIPHLERPDRMHAETYS